MFDILKNWIWYGRTWKFSWAEVIAVWQKLSARSNCLHIHVTITQKKQLLTFVCKDIYIFKGIRRNWDTVGEYGPFTLLATDPKLCIFILLYLFKFLSRSLLSNICKNFYLLYLSPPKRNYSRPLSFPLDLLRETLSSYE